MKLRTGYGQRDGGGEGGAREFGRGGSGRERMAELERERESGTERMVREETLWPFSRFDDFLGKVRHFISRLRFFFFF